MIALDAKKAVLSLKGLAAWLNDRAAMIERQRMLGKPQALALLRKELVATAARSFLNSATPAGVRWAALKYRAGAPLLLTGNLYEQTIAGIRSARITKGKAYDVSVDLAPYAPYHQHGTRTIPSRQFFGLSPESLRRFGGGIAAIAGAEIVSPKGLPGG